MEQLLWMYVAAGVLMIALAIPLLLGSIPPNLLYGFRIRKTLENPEVWYPANKYGAKMLIVAGLCTVLAAIGFYFIPGLGVDGYSIAVLAVLVASLGPGLVLAFRYVASL